MTIILSDDGPKEEQGFSFFKSLLSFSTCCLNSSIETLHTHTHTQRKREAHKNYKPIEFKKKIKEYLHTHTKENKKFLFLLRDKKESSAMDRISVV